MKSRFSRSDFGLSRLSRPMDGDVWAIVVALYTSACVILGGGAVSGYFADFVLQLLAIPVLLAGLWRMAGDDPAHRRALQFCGALVLVPLLQLVPLPPAVWTLLPFRDVSAQALSLANQELGWRPLTLTPHATWLTLASLLPPLGVFFASIRLPCQDRRIVVLALLAAGLLSSFAGLLQVALGPSGSVSDAGPAAPGEATGFFANRNHFAALLYVLLLFSAVWVIECWSALSLVRQGGVNSAPLIRSVAFFTLMVVFLAAELMARSRAGLGLTILALFGIAALASADRRLTKAQRTDATRLVWVAAGLVILFGAQFALYRMMERFTADPLQDARIVFARNTWEASVSFLPFGSGLGSFVPVYQFFEKPQDALLDTYANRAHNDFLETALETGVVGILLMALFAVWFGKSLWRVWTKPEDAANAPLDAALARAASIAIILLALHSLVDYPLRTTALMAVAAVACAILIPPPYARRAGKAHDTARPVRKVIPRRIAWTDAPATVAESQRQEIDPISRAAPSDAAAQWNWPKETPSEFSPTTDEVSKRARSGNLWKAAWPRAWQEDVQKPEPESGEKPREEA